MWPAVAAAVTPAIEEWRRLAVPEVPFLPQTESLCGGAALAMVLRYWGEALVRPQDFAGALPAAGGGITTEALRQLAEARGYRALAFRGERSEAIAQLGQGRPLIALIAAGKRGYHYVVLLAWANGSVLVHDPALAPFRVIPEAEWQRRWNASGRWALLILPPERRASAQAPVDEAAQAADACAALVRPAVETADRGDLESAKRELAAAAELCPDSSSPVRESAGLELRRENWARAAELAERAVARNPDDALSWRLLATSRFLEGKPEAALSAWNRIGEPTLDLVRIDGLVRTPFRSVYDYLGGEDGEVLTPGSLRRAERRAADLPAASGSRVSYRPLPGGRVQLEAAIVERPTIDPLPALLFESAARAFVDHAAALDLANVTASGDGSRLFWRWQPNRPQVALAASAPRAMGLPGIVTAQVLWDEQSYASAAGEGTVVREARKRASLSLQDWRSADSKLELALAVDQWNDRGRALSIAGGVDHRLANDRVAVGGRLAGWAPLRSGPPFYAGSLSVKARSGAAGARRPALRLDLDFEAASARAPLALWSGAGTGLGRDLMLRAHPLVRDGIIDGPCFGREIVSASAQAESPRVYWGPLALTAALFVDSARVLTRLPGASAPRTLVDVGAGLRLRLPGRHSTLRADVATPWGAVRPILSVGWQAQWPE